MHSLELLPGIGKKFMWQILKERQKTLFTSFQDIAERTHIRSPKDLIIKRILSELQREDKYSLFTRKPATDREMGRT